MNVRVPAKILFASVLLLCLVPPLVMAADPPSPNDLKEQLDAGLLDPKEYEPAIQSSTTGCSPEYGTGSDLYFGYTLKDSREPDGPAYHWVDISGTGTAVYMSDDDYDGPFPIGFPFDLYGSDYAQFYMGSNGFLSFGAGSSDLGNDCPLPSLNTPHNLIALMWDDLDPGDTGDAAYYESFAAGACPYGGYPGACLIVQYENYHHFPGGGAIAGTFEAILFDNHDILIQFQDPGAEQGEFSTTGIENLDGSDGLAYACDMDGSLSYGLAVQFYYPEPAPNLVHSSKQATPKVELGDPIRYTIDIVNSGTLPAPGTVITDIIPAGTTFIPGSLECSLGTCWYDAGDDAVYWSGDMAAAAVKGYRPTAGTLLASEAVRGEEWAAPANEQDLPRRMMPSTAPPGPVIENFANTWDISTAGLVYDPSRDHVRYAHEMFTTADIWDVDYPVPHATLGNILLSSVNPGWPPSLDQRNGAGYDVTIDTYFLPDFGGDGGINADDNIVEIAPDGTILNAWETNGAGNDSYDGSSIGPIKDIAIVPGAPTRYFATALYDGSVVYEIDLIKTNVWWSPNTWGTLGTCTVPGLGDNGSIDYDAEHDLLYHSDNSSTNIVITDLDCNVVGAFTCDSPAGFNSGVTYVEGKSEPEIWVTDWTSDSTTRCSLPPACEPLPLFFDDFETGLGAWTATGLWNEEHDSDTCGALVAPFPTSDTGAYYGQDGTCTYDTGITNTGTLEMVYNVDLSRVSNATLKFWSYENTECGFGNCTFDQRYVDVSTDGGATWATVWASTGPENQWYQASTNLALYAGGPLRVRFRFDTVDPALNAFFGWLVDNVEIVGCMPSTSITFAVEAPAWCGEVTNRAVVDAPGAEPVVMGATTHIVDDLYVLWDFEIDDGGFVPGPAGEWRWGPPSYPPNLAAHSGSKVWGTDLHGNADDTVGHHLLTKTLTLPSDPNGVYLEWWDWYGAESDDTIRVTVDGTPVYERYNVNQRHWTHHEVDISAWAGQTVDIVFDLEVCCTNPGPDGWYIDDVAVHIGCHADIAVDPSSLASTACSDQPRHLELSICNNDNRPLWWYLKERDGTVALFKDADPWGATDPEDFLAASNIPYELHTSAEFGSLDLDDYAMIVISGDQPQAFYDAYAGHVADLTAYVEGGGFLNFFAADQGWNGGFLTSPLPGGMTWHFVPENYNEIVAPAHPVVQGVSSPFYGTSASHGHFEDLPAGAHVIAHEQSGGLPTIVEYPLSAGWLIAFGQPLEYAHREGQDAGSIMENTLLWGHRYFASEVDWLSESPLAGMVLPGDCLPAEVTLDGGGMPLGDYAAEFTVWSNDPDTPALTVPVDMALCTCRYLPIILRDYP